MLRKYSLEMTVFLCGAMVMVFEILGSRVLGPYVGTSTYVWTSLIGVILGSLSIGYALGGQLADEIPGIKPLAYIIMIASAAVLWTALGKDVVPALIAHFGDGAEIKSIIMSVVLFSPASIALGMVTPFAVKLRMIDVANAGTVSGNLYAISTVGSIVGTFVAGFFILPSFGTKNTLMGIAVILLSCSLLLLWKGIGKKTIIASALLLLCGWGVQNVNWSPKSKLVADIDTEYSRIWIFGATDSVTKKPVMSLSTDPYGTQSSAFADGSTDLVAEYSRYYDLFRYFTPSATSALMIGGCAYTYPRYFLDHYPDLSLDVVEIDPGMTDIARQYFGLEDSSKLKIIHEDGRIYLNNTTKRYDAIFGDAFTSSSSLPFQLTTKEAIQKEYDALNDGGVVIVNLISSVTGKNGLFARAEYATYRAVFPQVYLFPIGEKADHTQNIMLVGYKSSIIPSFESPDPVVAALLNHRWTSEIAADVPVLTDDFAPVDYYKRVSLD